MSAGIPTNVTHIFIPVSGMTCNYTPTSSAEIKNAWISTYIINKTSWIDG